MAPSDEAELVHAVATAVAIDDRPSAFRYPRGEGVGVALPERGEVLPLGKGRVLREGNSIAILSLGPRLADALKAADELAARGLPTTVADARFAKPLDTALVEQLARHHEVLITIEEGSIGGFGSAVLHHLAWKGLLDGGLKVRPMVLPDVFIDHDSQAKQLAEAGLTARDIVATALRPRTGGGVASADRAALGNQHDLSGPVLAVRQASDVQCVHPINGTLRRHADAALLESNSPARWRRSAVVTSTRMNCARTPCRSATALSGAETAEISKPPGRSQSNARACALPPTVSIATSIRRARCDGGGSPAGTASAVPRLRRKSRSCCRAAATTRAPHRRASCTA